MGRVKVDLGWLALMCGLYYLDESGLFFIFLSCVFLHELGHFSVLKLQKIPVYACHFTLCGAALETGTMGYRQEILCALAGPLVNLILVSLAGGFPRFATVNLGLALFNLLPIFPLDGGRALRAGLLWKLPPNVAEGTFFLLQWATAIALAAGAVYWGILCHGGLWPFFLLFLLGIRIAATNLAENRL